MNRTVTHSILAALTLAAAMAVVFVLRSPSPARADSADQTVGRMSGDSSPDPVAPEADLVAIESNSPAARAIETPTTQARTASVDALTADRGAAGDVTDLPASSPIDSTIDSTVDPAIEIDEVSTDADTSSGPGALTSSSTAAVQPIENARLQALAWLAEHQAKGGGWSAPEYQNSQVRIAGLCLLAFTVSGHAGPETKYHEQLTRAARWVEHRQNRETGKYGRRSGLAGCLDHAICTYAMGEYHAASDPALRNGSQPWRLTLALAWLNDHETALDGIDYSEDESLLQRWKATTRRLKNRLYSRLRGRIAEGDGQSFLDWRSKLYSSYSFDLGADDGFAKFALLDPTTRRAKDAARIKTWMDDELLMSGVDRVDGALRSNDPHHDEIGVTGVTALYAIAASAVIDQIQKDQ